MDCTEIKSRKRISAGALVIVLLLAFALRIWGLTYGLPYSFILDETFVVNHSLAFGTGDLNPHFFEWPGSLLFYVLFAIYGIYFILGFAAGHFGNPQDFALAFLSDPTAFYLIGRTFTVILSTLTVFAAYVLAKQNYGTGTGLVAALLLSVSPLLSGVSHFTLTDTPLGLLCVLAFIPLCKAAETGSLRDYAWSGLLIGLAASVKYNAGALILPFAVAHVLYVFRTPGRHFRSLVFDRRVALAAGCILAGFVIGCPFSVLDYQKFYNDVLFQFSRVSTLGNIHAEYDSPLLFYAKVALGKGVGIGITLLCLAGMFRAVFRRKTADIVLISYIIGYIAYISRWKVAVDKYLIPVVPLLVIIGAAFFCDVYRRYAKESQLVRVMAFAVMILLIAAPMQNSIQIDRTLIRKDTRKIAKDWIEQNIPPGTKIAIDSGRFDVAKLSPPLEDVPQNLYENYIGGKNSDDNRFIKSGRQILRRYYELKVKSSSGKTYPLTRIVISSEGKIDRNISVDRFIASKVKYVVVSSYAYEGYFDKAYQENHPEAAAFYTDFYKSLDTRCTLVKEIPQEPQLRQGPEIRIFKVPS